MSRARLNLFIEPDHARRLDELAAMKGLSKSSIVAAALASFLSPDSGDQREAAIAKRLDRTPVPEAHQEAARAQGRARFEQFVEQLGRHLLRGRSLVKDVVEEIQPDQSQFFGLQENANTVSSTDDPGTPS